MAGMDRSPENVKRLAAKHVARYTAQLEAALNGRPGFNARENTRLLAIWMEITKRGCQYDACDPEARCEIDDALDAGE